MEAKNPHTRGHGDSGACPCRCGNKISSKDPHQVCSSCLGLKHARLAIDVPGSCQLCAVFTIKSLRRRLTRQASLSGHDPYLPPGGAVVEDGEKREVVAVAAPEVSASWGSQLDLAAGPPQEEDVLELDYGGDEEGTSELLISEDEDEDDLFRDGDEGWR